MRSALLLAFVALVPAAVAWMQFREHGAELLSGEVEVNDSKIAGAETVWIDARSRVEFEKAHADGAISLNQEDWDTSLGDVFAAWQPGRAIVVYCDAGCEASSKIADRLRELGMEPVFVLKGGYEAWIANRK